MSTKAIRMALKEMKKTSDWLIIDEALQEVEAIERAAKTIAGYATNRYPKMKELRAATRTMESIAKDVP